MENEINEIHGLYKKNLPEIVRNEETVKRILGDINNHIIRYRTDGQLAGVSVINENTIYLLCVDKAFQGRGIGIKLLHDSEKYAASNDSEKVVLGAGRDYIMPGVPMNNGVHNFFMKQGYTHSWGNVRCFDMEQMLTDFNHNEHSVGDTISGVTYRWATIDDLDGILKSLSDNEEDFTVYYKNKEYYEKGTNSRVLIAENDNEVLGTLHVSIEVEGKDMGSIGLTATACKHRNKGIGTNMVTLGTKYLKDIGLKKAHLGYTYTDIVNLYGRAGYKVCMEYFMGEKSLNNIRV